MAVERKEQCIVTTRREVPYTADELETLDALLQYCQETLLAHVGSEVKGIIMARKKSTVTRLRLCAHSNTALY